MCSKKLESILSGHLEHCASYLILLSLKATVQQCLRLIFRPLIRFLLVVVKKRLLKDKHETVRTR